MIEMGKPATKPRVTYKKGKSLLDTVKSFVREKHVSLRQVKVLL